MVLIALAAAHAAPLVAHVSASVGLHYVAGLAPGSLTGGELSRVELGVGPPEVQGYLAVQLALHDAPAFYELDAATVYGDVLVSNVGAGARLPKAFGVFRLVPHGNLGLALVDSPLTEEAAAELGYATAGPHARGLWVQAGLDVGLEIQPDAVTVFLASDVGYVTGFGVTVSERFGLAAQF